MTQKASIASLAGEVQYRLPPKLVIAIEKVRVLMMKTYDFFTLTGLSFDPPDKSQKRVEKAISEAVFKISSQLGCESQQLYRDAFQTQLDFLNQQSALINTAGWLEASKYFAALSAKRKKQECEKVQFAASLLAQNGIKSLDKRILQSLRMKTGLSIETLTQLLEKSGINLHPSDLSDKFPKFPMNGERIQIELEELRATKDPNPNGPDTSRVTDLYIFAAYLMDDLGHANLYKDLSTSELKTIFDLATRKYSCRIDNLGMLCCSISSSASHYVFNSDDSRKGYEALMLYHHVALQSLFDALKILPTGILLQPNFAEKCIKLIGVFFPDYETALAIYNKEGNLSDVPYLPSKSDEAAGVENTPKQQGASKHTDSRIYGISFGTSYSAIATLCDAGIPEVITNQNEGSDLLASAVYFQDGADPIVGEIAKSQKDIEPEKVVEFVKRYIGKPDAPTYEFDGVKYDPITITALIFKRMVQYADWQGYEVENVVLTCPSYFGIEERTALKQAATIAGLNVLDIINEPTAAVLSSFSLEELQTSKRILVYDLGGNTFDLTLIISSFNGIAVRLDTIRTGGNDRLGGIDWDSRLLDIMSQKYAFETGIEESDIDNELRATIASHVERIKKALSSRVSASYIIKYDGDRTKFAVSRQEFEENTQDLVQQTMGYVHQILSDTDFSPDDVDVVLLVGGSTLMPMIPNAVEAVFPGKVRVEQPNLAVAKGAVVYSTSSCEEFFLEPAPEDITDGGPWIPLTRKSIGVGIFDSDGYRIKNILFMNDALPAVAQRKYYTASDDLEKICLTLYSNVSRDEFIASRYDKFGNPQTADSDLDINRIGVFEMLLPPGTPKGTEIEVLFKNTGDMLEVKATIVKTGEETTTVFEI